MDYSNFNQAVSDNELGKQVGNAMSVNVLERLFKHVLEAANLADNLPDRWADGTAYEQLGVKVSTKTSFVRPIQPDPGRIVKGLSAKGMPGRSFIVDSGASYHMISWKDLTDKEKKTKRLLDHPVELYTANGKVSIKHEVLVLSLIHI